MSEKTITMEWIDALIAKAMRGELGKSAEVKPSPSSRMFRDRTDDFDNRQRPIQASSASIEPSGRISTMRPVSMAKRSDPAIVMQREMNRLGIKSDDTRKFTIDLAGRLMYYGEDHRPLYVETGTRTPLDSAHSMPAIEPAPLDSDATRPLHSINYPSGVVKAAEAASAMARDGGAIVVLVEDEGDPLESDAVRRTEAAYAEMCTEREAEADDEDDGDEPPSGSGVRSF